MRIKASTLLETVASMAIIGCVLSCAGLIYSNVLAGDSSAERTKARLVIDKEVTSILTGARIELQEHQVSSYRVMTTSKSMGNSRRELHISVMDASGRLLLEEYRSLTAQWND